MLINSVIIMLISLMMMFMASLISKKSFNDREKCSPFECGFDPKSSPRLPFSLHFFLIALIFLIFDIEITLLIPLIYMIKFMNYMNFLIIWMVFLSILLIGLLHEWNQGALNWLF
uniref:NADH-ubiquinone oxidoreductase chain 3 n=1 Tax=Pselaphinae sp. 12 EF-2015 TaxID=1756871 RepID=A0A0S2M8G3_9COLE|nr:NADH deshydrogenase subunit 3 [Pselaphinae sp. 12 EF-2015]